jgi:lipoprotein-anchoring transpeptidase ErfK/SrfK
MRGLAGSAVIAVLLVGSPLGAQESSERPVAAAPQAVEMPTKEPAPQSPADRQTPPAAREVIAVGSDTVAAPPVVIELAPPPPPPPPITLVLNTDLRAQRVTVIENGKAKYTWPISSGRRGYATPTGTFRPQWASKMWYSRQYEYASMPHAVFFHRGTAFHGTGAVGMLGQPASHGCVRLAPGNAAQLFKLVHKHGYASTKVVVHGGSKNKAPAVARRGSRGEVAIARPAQRGNYRVSRASMRRSSTWAD